MQSTTGTLSHNRKSLPHRDSDETLVSTATARPILCTAGQYSNILDEVSQLIDTYINTDTNNQGISNE